MADTATGAGVDFGHASFQRHLNEHRLMGARCSVCGQVHLPPRPVCSACGSDALEWVELSGEGTLAAFTTIHIAPTAMIQAGYGRDNPYCSGVVQLDGGPAISAQIVGVDPTKPETIRIGTPVRLTFIERGEGDAKRTYLAYSV